MAETTSVADRLLEIASEEAGVGVDVRERVETRIGVGMQIPLWGLTGRLASIRE